VPNRIIPVENECPNCLQYFWEDVEVADETPVDLADAVCPHCGHVEPSASFVEYDDDVWRKPGANPDFP
jgi:hypothetical protein